MMGLVTYGFCLSKCTSNEKGCSKGGLIPRLPHPLGQKTIWNSCFKFWSKCHVRYSFVSQPFSSLSFLSGKDVLRFEQEFETTVPDRFSPLGHGDLGTRVQYGSWTSCIMIEKLVMSNKHLPSIFRRTSL